VLGSDPRNIIRAASFKAEVLLDRLDRSQGIIDGKPRENVRKAIAAFQRSRGLRRAASSIERPGQANPRTRALIAYTITDDDVRGLFVPEIPLDLEGMARLSELGLPEPAELLAEKFHASEEVMKLLNPGETVISVPDVASPSNPVGLVWIELTKPTYTSWNGPSRGDRAKPGRMAASGLPIGMPLTLPSGLARARRSRSSIRPKLPASSRLIRGGRRLSG